MKVAVEVAVEIPLRVTEHTLQMRFERKLSVLWLLLRVEEPHVKVDPLLLEMI